MQRKARYYLLLVLTATIAAMPQAMAGDKKQKHKVDRKAWNPYACCHDINAIEHTPTLITERYLVPDFYTIDSVMKGDTAYVYECYDTRDSIMNMDTVADFNKVRYISLVKNFTDHEHTYRDYDGTRKPLPVSVIAKRYDKTGSDKWMAISYPGNKFELLKEYRNVVVRTDSFMERTPGGNEVVLSIYEHYKVSNTK